MCAYYLLFVGKSGYFYISKVQKILDAKMINFLNLSVNFKKKIPLFFGFLNQKKYPFYFFIITIFFVIYALVLGQIKSYTELKENNFNSFLRSDEFTNIKGFVFKNINSPYKEYNYTVKNNDTLEKILKKYNINSDEINRLTREIIKKKLSNIDTGTQIQIVTKEEKGTNRIISLFYPIDAITSVGVKRNKDIFEISKIILELRRKEVILSNTIKNNLYSSAVDAGI